MSLPASSLPTAVAALALVLGLVWLAARAVRASGLNTGRLGSGSTARRLFLQESLALDRTRRLCLVRCDGRDLVLLTGGNTDQVVGWLPPTPELPR